MKILAIISVVWISICALVLLFLHIKSHKMLKSIFLNAFLGIAAVAVINLTQKYTGVFVPVNWYTVVGSGMFGLPCVCGIILLQMFI